LGAEAHDAESILAFKHPKEVAFHVINMVTTHDETYAAIREKREAKGKDKN